MTDLKVFIRITIIQEIIIHHYNIPLWIRAKASKTWWDSISLLVKT